MIIGVVGGPNKGKSTFFSAATLVDVEIANRPFTTIKPNQGTAYVSTKCVHEEKEKPCQPVNSKCENSIRLIPITLLDVAGLVPDAHKGKGLGNDFMNDLMQAKALIQVLDASGRTDLEGNSVESNDPAEDVRFLEKEISYWINGILTKNWGKISKQASLAGKASEGLANQLTGLGITEDEVKSVLEKGSFSEKPDSWSEEEILRFSEEIRKKSKPMIVVANKIDLEGAKENYERLVKEFPQHIIIPCCSEAELALRKAAKAGIIEYVPGSSEFKLLKQELPEKQRKALEFIMSNVLKKWGSTGVQQAINKTAFGLLSLIVVYPVQDSNKWQSGKGNFLPDAYLLRKGSTAIRLAEAIHSGFVERFIAAVDCRTGQRIGKDHELKNNDVIKIQLSH